MNYYLVPLYMLELDNFSIKKVFIDNIIVKKSIFGIEELFTGYNKILLLDKVYYSPSINNRDYLLFRNYCKGMIENNGCMLYVFKDSINNDNKINIKEINYNNFESSNWNKFYNNMVNKDNNKKKIKKRS